MTLSFFHAGNASMASYRYRAQIPAQALEATLNDESADVWILAKPDADSLALMERAHRQGKRFIVDICDAHLQQPLYRALIQQADQVTASTPFLASLIRDDLRQDDVQVIDDPYEFPERPPHMQGRRVLWFGHPTNYYSLEPWLPHLTDYDLRVMTNKPGCVPYSLDGLHAEFAQADIVILPETAPYKSANRAVEAIRSGCFVVADYHPALTEIPGIWTGHIVKGLAWATQHPSMCREQLTQSQAYVRDRYSPERVANAWKMLVMGSMSISAVDTSPGRAGSISMVSGPRATPISSRISAPCH